LPPLLLPLPPVQNSVFGTGCDKRAAERAAESDLRLKSEKQAYDEGRYYLHTSNLAASVHRMRREEEIGRFFRRILF